jgi:hypothetical protein
VQGVGIGLGINNPVFQSGAPSPFPNKHKVANTDFYFFYFFCSTDEGAYVNHQHFSMLPLRITAEVVHEFFSCKVRWPSGGIFFAVEIAGLYAWSL